MRSKRNRSESKEIQVETLPMLGLFVVLIPMLLLSAVFVQLNVIQLEAAAEESNPEPERGLELAVHIAETHYLVTGRGVTAIQIEAGDKAMSDLRATLDGIHENYPAEASIQIVSQANTLYETVIDVMDASRESGFPGISLASKGL